MITNTTPEGNVQRTFEHVTPFELVRFTADSYQSLIIVLFDGQPDLWYVSKGSDTASAITELREYYREDWAGTNRELPFILYRPVVGDEIDCRPPYEQSEENYFRVDR